MFIHTIRNKELYIPATLGMKGRVKATLIHARTGIIKQQLEFDNLLVDAGLDALMNNRVNVTLGSINLFAVGTGSTPPAVTDTSLENIIGSTTNNGGFTDQDEAASSSNDYTYHRTKTRVFIESEANGNLTEFGVHLGSSLGAPLFCRHLFVDENGDPVTIVKTNEDQLRIDYTIYVKAPVDTTVIEDFMIPTPANPGGVPTTVSMRAFAVRDSGGTDSAWGANVSYGPNGMGSSNINNYTMEASESDELPAITDINLPFGAISSGSYTPTSPDTNRKPTYVPGSFELLTRAVWGPSASFPTGIGVVALSMGNAKAGFALHFSPKIPKSGTERVVIIGGVKAVRI